MLSIRHFTAPRTVLMQWIVFAFSMAIAIAVVSTQVSLVVIYAGILVIIAFISPMAALSIMLVVSPLKVLIATEAEFQLPMDIGQLCLIVVILTISLNHAYKDFKLKDCIKQFPLLFVILAGFLAILTLNGLIARSLTAWLTEFLKWIQIVSVTIITISVSKHTHWSWLLSALIIAGMSNAMIGIYQYFGGSGAIHLLVNERFFRSFGTFGQPNPFGGFLGIITPIAIAMAVPMLFRCCRPHISVSGLLLFASTIAASCLMLSGIVMSWSRGAWIGLIVALAVMIIALPKKLWKGLSIGSVVLLLFVGLWFTNALPDPVVARLESSVNELLAFQDVRGVDIDPSNYSVVERLAHWQSALNMAQSAPWLGVGFGSFENAYEEFRLFNWSEPLGHAHNYYLNLLGEAGILGVLVYGKVWFILFTMAWQARKHPNSIARSAVIGLLGSWTYFSIHSLFDNLYVNNVFLHLGTLIGILVVIHAQAHKNLEVNSCSITQ